MPSTKSPPIDSGDQLEWRQAHLIRVHLAACMVEMMLIQPKEQPVTNRRMKTMELGSFVRAPRRCEGWAKQLFGEQVEFATLRIDQVPWNGALMIFRGSLVAFYLMR